MDLINDQHSHRLDVRPVEVVYACHSVCECVYVYVCGGGMGAGG
jgi:hypothetical protein